MPPSIRRIEFSPDLTEQVYERLLNAICDGSLAPEARLTQEDLAASLAVSRQPVMQALRMLKRDGFVVDAGRRGLRVAPLDPELIIQVYDVRATLDGLAARRAALSQTAIDLRVIGEGRKAAAGNRIGPMIDADLRFHHSVYSASGNPLIAASADHHWRHIRRAMGAVLQSEGARKAVWDEHDAILKAINDGNAARAEHLARCHAEAAGRSLAVRLRKHVRRAVLNAKPPGGAA